ncbi:MAG: phasin family protein [Pseudomonadota bacterium]
MTKAAKTTAAKKRRATGTRKTTTRRPRIAAEGVTPKPETSTPVPSTTRDDMFAFGAPFLTSATQDLSAHTEKFQDHARETGVLIQERMTATAAHINAVQDDMVAAMQDDVSAAVTFGQDLMGAQTIGDIFDLQRQFFTTMVDGRITRLRNTAEATSAFGRESMNKARAHQEETIALIAETTPMGGAFQSFMDHFAKA